MQASDVNDNATLRQYLEESGCELRQLGMVLGDFPVFCAITGGTKEPSILITSGAHADEVAGVQAALTLLRELRTDHRVYVVPVRDPFGFEGYRANLHFAAGSQVSIGGPADVYALLKHGDVLYEHGTYILSQIGKYVFAYDVGVDFPTSSVGRRIDSLVKEDPALLKRLVEAERVIAPWNLPMPRSGDYYKRGARGMIVKASGFVGNFNRFFDVEDAPPEVIYPRALVAEIKPGLVLDLHEGYGRGFYLYKPESSNPLTEQIVNALTTAVKEQGGQTSTPAELQPYWGPSLGSDRTYFGKGVFYSGSSTRSDFSNYCLSEKVLAFTFETGGLNPVKWRADMQCWAAVAAITRWEKQNH